MAAMEDMLSLTLNASRAAKTAVGEATGADGPRWKIVPGLLLAAILGFGGLAGWHPAAAAQSVAPATAPVTITPSGYDAWAGFEALTRQGGPQVLVLGGLDWLPDR
jgi:hypothetical protein